MRKQDQQDDFDSDDDSVVITAGRYEEDEDYHEPGKKKRSVSSKSSDKKKNKKRSKQESDEEQPDNSIDDNQRSVPPLKIKIALREKSKRTKRNKDLDESAVVEETEPVESKESKKSTKVEEASSSTTTNAPTRRSERIFVSNAKKIDSAQETESNDQDDMEDFKILHKDHCQSCRQSGELILCDYCPRAYHKVCLDEDLTDLPDDWCCPHCQKNGKPNPKDLRQQQAAMVAKKKKKLSINKPKIIVKRNVENRDYCEICNQCGELLLCDTCPRAYHLVCMDQDMKNIPTGNWSCPYCESHGIDSSNLEPEEKTEKVEKVICKTCRQTGGDIVNCATCSMRVHIGCLNPPLESMPEVWHCLACSVEPLKAKVQRIITWRWKKTAQEQENEKNNLSAEDTTKNLLKNLKNRKPREREFFVKWKDMSYWHCSWIDEGQLLVFHGSMYRFYATKNDMTNPPVFDEVGMLTTNLSDPKTDESNNNNEESAAAIATRHRRRKRCHELPAEVEENFIRFGVRPEWLLIHRVINHRRTRGQLFYLIKWRELPYEEVTCEEEPCNSDFEIPGYDQKITEYWNHRRLVAEETATEEKIEEKRKSDRHKSKDKKKSHKKSFGMYPKTDPKKKFEVQPEYVPEPLQLHNYQLDGINWLRYSWASGIDTILADEMGLGKTIQTVSFLYSLYKEGHSRGPFLIAAPLSTIINWERELEDWAPDFYVVNYTGNKDSRIIIRENELSYDTDAIRSCSKATRIRKQAPVKFHVLLTSYELINVDTALLGSIEWKVLVVDEAHRLKSNQSLFFRTLNQYSVGHKLLLTGTPLQNNLEELFNLLNFLSPNRFNDMDGFLNEFADIAKEEQVKKLHELLGPHLLRRLKADVLTGMPAKSEFIVRVDLAPLQKKYYKYILTRNFDALNSKGGGKQVSLLNIVMDLKKCCNHPYLFPVASEEAPKTKLGYYEGTALTKACGKLIVLQKMLRKLKEDGHRVLIFSQMTHMLDVLEDFLEAEGYKYERIDGSITGTVRQEAIDRFNAPGAKQFVFLLSTRAGGLGINLATADTVVIYDSDWNPHNDIQALSRAHRIGQTNKVMIYRFVTRHSVEERITQVAKKKMMLTHLVVRPGLGSNKSQATMSKQELDDILKFGTEELFKEEEAKESEMIHYDDKAIEELLDRTKEGIEQKEVWSNEYLSSFKVASYVTKEADEIEEELEESATTKQKDETQNDPHYWEKLLGVHYLQFQENLSRSLGKGKRVRKQVNYLDSASGQNDYQNQESSESSDFSVPSDVSENDEDFDERMEGRNQKTRNKNPIKEKMPPLLSTVGGTLEVYGFTPKQRKFFYELVMRFGLPNLDYNFTDSQFYARELKNKPEKHLRAYTSLFMNHLCEPGDPNASTFEDGVPKEGVNISHVLSRIGIISLIKRKVYEYESINGCISMKITRRKVKPEIVNDEKSGSEEPAVDDKVEVKKEINTDEPEKMDIDEQKVSENKEQAKTENNEKVEDTKYDTEKKENTENKDTNTNENVKSEIKEEEKDKSTEEIKKEETKPNPTDVEMKGNENGQNSKQEEEEVEIIEEIELVPVEFNIKDGGFTELHTIWYFEEQELKPQHEHETWNKRHDYWMLAGIVKHGYEQWAKITTDPDFLIINEPFKSSPALREKFMERRLRLLEQALVFEEQLRRISHLTNQEIYVPKPKEEAKDEEGMEENKTNGETSDNQKNEEKTSENEEKNKEQKPNDNSEKKDPENCENKENTEEEMILNPKLQRASNQLEELLNDMKSDCARIPQTVQRIPSIASRLQLGPRNMPNQMNMNSMQSSHSLLSSNRM